MVPVPSQSIAKALDVAKENRFELKLQKNKERLAALTLSSIRSERIPSIQASGDVGLIGNEISNMLTNDSIQVLMSVPIFDGGQREGVLQKVGVWLDKSPSIHKIFSIK